MRHIYLDEQISEHFAPALNVLEPNPKKIEVTSTIYVPGLGRKVPDITILQVLLANDAYLLTSDRDFRQLFSLASQVPGVVVRIFHYPNIASKSHWDKVKHIMNAWPAIRKVVLTTDPAESFCYLVQTDGIERRG